MGIVTFVVNLTKQILLKLGNPVVINNVSKTIVRMCYEP